MRLYLILTVCCLISFAGLTQTMYSKVSHAASFPGGNAAMVQYINKNIQYPAQATESGIEGRVTLRAVINETGHVQQVTVLRGIGGGCDSVAVRVIKGMPQWEPALYHGKPVKAVVAIPVRFELD